MSFFGELISLVLPPKNVISVCSECSYCRKRKWQEENSNTPIVVGGYCKIQFNQEDCNPEHMWVKVSEVLPDNYFKGILDNDPSCITRVKCGDTVTFSRSEIEDYLVE